MAISWCYVYFEALINKNWGQNWKGQSELESRRKCGRDKSWTIAGNTQSHDWNDVVFAEDKFSTVKKLVFLKGLGMYRLTRTLFFSVHRDWERDKGK